MFKRAAAVLCAVVLTGAIADTASAQHRDRDRDVDRGRGGMQWEELGCMEVRRREDLEVIKVGRKEGRYKAIKLTAEGGDISLEDIRVVYGNGEPDNLQVRGEIKAGQESRPLDLKGRERAIDRIELVAKKDNDGRYRDWGRGGEYRRWDRDGDRGDRRRPKLCVLGLQDERFDPRFADQRDDHRRDGPRGGQIVELGCQKVGFMVDRDVITVGRREGRFKAVRVRVQKVDVFMENLRVIYANGDPDDLPVREKIKKGTETRWIDLKGRERAIERIELIYRGKLSLKGSAHVCIDALD